MLWSFSRRNHARTKSRPRDASNSSIPRTHVLGSNYGVRGVRSVRRVCLMTTVLIAVAVAVPVTILTERYVATPFWRFVFGLFGKEYYR